MSTIEVGKILTTIGPADAVKVFHEYYNAGEKEIKYITFSYVPYNSVNDVVACTASGKTEVSGKLTGPIPSKHKSHVTWENMWFNPTVTKAILTKMHIEFMDGTEEVIEREAIIKAEEERIVIEKARKKMSSDSEKVIAEVFEEFKTDEETLLKILDGVDSRIIPGYHIGDYIEKNYPENEELMKKAVAIWKASLTNCQKYYAIGDAAKKRLGLDLAEVYAEKIKKYEPTYVMPPKAGCLSVFMGSAQATF